MAEYSPAPGVPQTATKAQVAALVTTIGAMLTFVVAYFPENDDIQVWGGLAVGLLTIVANAWSVYSTPNKPTP
jgi:hypothetical protein